MKEAYLKHCDERKSENLPPLALDAKQTKSVVESLLEGNDDEFNLPSIDIINSVVNLFFLTNPHAPSGRLFSQSAIFSIASQIDALLVVDEAYVEFVEDQSILTQLSNYDNLIVVQTFSKAQGLAGVRLGMCFADPDIIHLMNKIKTPYNINVLTQEVVLKRLEEQGLIQQQIQQILAEKDRIINEISTLYFIKKMFH